MIANSCRIDLDWMWPIGCKPLPMLPLETHEIYVPFITRKMYAKRLRSAHQYRAGIISHADKRGATCRCMGRWVRDVLCGPRQ